MPIAAPTSAEMEQKDTAVPTGTEVLHIYSTGLNGSLPHDMPAEQSAAISICEAHMGLVSLKCLQTRMLQAWGCTAGKRAGPTRIMHTMASKNAGKHSLRCFALSADVHSFFQPPITALAHFHPAWKFF